MREMKCKNLLPTGDRRDEIIEKYIIPVSTQNNRKFDVLNN